MLAAWTDQFCETLRRSERGARGTLTGRCRGLRSLVAQPDREEGSAVCTSSSPGRLNLPSALTKRSRHRWRWGRRLDDSHRHGDPSVPLTAGNPAVDQAPCPARCTAGWLTCGRRSGLHKALPSVSVKGTRRLSAATY
ncbi:unnamed protein product [Arctogadus glacialis]